jgi:hypothetical protein
VRERWFLFVQMEIPWVLGPADGRYLLRDREEEPRHVVVLGTLDGRPLRLRGRRGGRARTGREVPAEPEAARVAITRATVVDPVPVAAEAQARAWLREMDVEREMWAATGVVNEVLSAHRIAAADAYVNAVSPAQALVVRAGWGVGEQVADGQWEHARELQSSRPGREGRSAVLRPAERLTWLLAGREEPLVCEELALRARRDLDGGWVRHAAVELRGAYAAALAELPAEGRQDLALRIDELRELSATIAQGEPSAEHGAPGGRGAAGGEGAVSHLSDPGEEAVCHALERLEAALRARSAGLKLSR